jgi:hypothetical protein
MTTPREDLNRDIKDPAFAIIFRWEQFKTRIGLWLFKSTGRNKLVDWLNGV